MTHSTSEPRTTSGRRLLLQEPPTPHNAPAPVPRPTQLWVCRAAPYPRSVASRGAGCDKTTPAPAQHPPARPVNAVLPPQHRTQPAAPPRTADRPTAGPPARSGGPHPGPGGMPDRVGGRELSLPTASAALRQRPTSAGTPPRYGRHPRPPLARERKESARPAPRQEPPRRGSRESSQLLAAQLSPVTTISPLCPTSTCTNEPVTTASTASSTALSGLVNACQQVAAQAPYAARRPPKAAVSVPRSRAARTVTATTMWRRPSCPGNGSRDPTARSRTLRARPAPGASVRRFEHRSMPRRRPGTSPHQLCRGGAGRFIRRRRRVRRRRRRRPPQDRVRPYRQAQTAQHLVGQGREECGEHGPVLGSELHFLRAELPFKHVMRYGR